MHNILLIQLYDVFYNNGSVIVIGAKGSKPHDPYTGASSSSEKRGVIA